MVQMVDSFPDLCHYWNHFQVTAPEVDITARYTWRHYRAFEHYSQTQVNKLSLENPKKNCVIWASFDWPIHVKEDFTRLLNEREQRALILLAHHSVLLKREEVFWYLDGHSRRLLSTIEVTPHGDMKRRIEWQCIEIREDQVM